MLNVFDSSNHPLIEKIKEIKKINNNNELIMLMTLTIG